MKTLYLECGMGAAGDMLTAALLELMPDGAARLQLPENQLPLLMEKRAELLNELKKHYPAVLLDLEVRG